MSIVNQPVHDDADGGASVDNEARSAETFGIGELRKAPRGLRRRPATVEVRHVVVLVGVEDGQCEGRALVVAHGDDEDPTLRWNMAKAPLEAVCHEAGTARLATARLNVLDLPNELSTVGALVDRHLVLQRGIALRKAHGDGARAQVLTEHLAADDSVAAVGAERAIDLGVLAALHVAFEVGQRARLLAPVLGVAAVHGEGHDLPLCTDAFADALVRQRLATVRTRLLDVKRAQDTVTAVQMSALLRHVGDLCDAEANSALQLVGYAIDKFGLFIVSPLDPRHACGEGRLGFARRDGQAGRRRRRRQRRTRRHGDRNYQ
mmetsp:Transcript_38463/g.118893  ORF Transcript_38463/g.118893 Transcript_38463/m.118893 type:complete len:319 (-) Transcript_38463:16-972(-)